MLKRLLLLSLLPFCSYAEELPAPVKAIEKQGITIIKPFDAPGGMKGWLGKYQDMGVAIYLTPDGKHAISGYMYDENGNNRWDADVGASGQGGARDVVVYRVTVAYDELVPLSRFVGLDPKRRFTAVTTLMNQPFATQADRTVKQICPK